MLKDQELDRIKNKMLEIGEKYADKLLTNQELNSKKLSQFFSICERSFKLVIDMQKNGGVYVDVIRKFASMIEEPLPRSEVYGRYLEFCASADLEPLSRNELYEKLRALKFEDKRRSDNVYFFPPRKKITPDDRTLAGLQIAGSQGFTDDDDPV